MLVAQLTSAYLLGILLDRQLGAIGIVIGLVVQLVLHPMLATGNSAVAAVDRLKESGAKSIRVVCLLACPQGI